MSPRKIFFALMIGTMAASAAPVAAQTTEGETAVPIALTKRVEDFFDNLKAPIVSADDAFEDLLATGPLAKQPEQVAAFVDSYKKLEASYGRFVVAKQVHGKRVGDDLAYLTFLYETEQFPIVWRFTFYRPPLESVERPDWFVVRLAFDTKLEKLSGLP